MSENTKPIDYMFVFSNGGWWLKIDSIVKLIDYHKQTNSRFNGAWELFIQLYEEAGDVNKIMDVVASYPAAKRFHLMQTREFKLIQAAIIEAQNMDGLANIFDGFRALNTEAGAKQLRNIRQYGACYINCVGGSTFSLEYTQFCRRSKMVFPHFQRDDIRVKQFRGGDHYYAYLGDMQVRDGDTLKWTSHEEAYAMALKYVG